MFYLYYMMIDDPDDCIKFDQIVETYESMMFRIILSVTKDESYAQEGLQSALVSIARNIADIRTDNIPMLKSYLYTVAEHAGIDAWRRKMHDSQYISLDDCTDMPSSDNVVDAVESAESIKQIIKMLDKMPVRYREVLVLYLLHEHSLYQIADELDRNYATVRQQLVRSKAMLKKMIKEAEQYD